MSDEQDTHEDEVEIITLVDEDGEEEDFVVVSFVELEDRTFAALAPAAQFFDEEASDEDPMELYVFFYTEDESGEANYDMVEDEALIERVIAVIDEQQGGEGDED